MERQVWQWLTRFWFVGLLGWTIGWSALAADEQDQLKVGVQPDGRILVPTNQILKPAGTQVTFPARPVDLAFADDGNTLAAKNIRDLVFLYVPTLKTNHTLTPHLPAPPNQAPTPPPLFPP